VWWRTCFPRNTNHSKDLRLLDIPRTFCRPRNPERELSLPVT
jgi:hypothetical protein